MPSALNNWLVLLGWGMPQGSSKNSEVFTEMEDLVSKVFTPHFSHTPFPLSTSKLLGLMDRRDFKAWKG